MADVTIFPPPPPPPSLPSSWVPVQLQDGPWRLPEERLQPGPLVSDLIFIAQTLRKGPMLWEEILQLTGLIFLSPRGLILLGLV